MNTQRLQKILARLEEQNLTQMIICDPMAINYLTGRMIDPGERLYALYINVSGGSRSINVIIYRNIYILNFFCSIKQFIGSKIILVEFSNRI